MKVLLDTCTFLWIVLDPARLAPTAARPFAEPGNTCFLGAVSAWEIGVKWAAGRLSLRQSPAVELTPPAGAAMSSSKPGPGTHFPPAFVWGVARSAAAR